MKKILFYGWLCLFLTSCFQKSDNRYLENMDKNSSIEIPFYDIEDLNFEVFDHASKHSDTTHYNKTYNPKVFLEEFYKPWRADRPALDTTQIKDLWKEYFTYTLGIAKKSPCYSGNLQEYSKKQIQIVQDNLPKKPNQDFLTPQFYGITTQTTDVRALPTNEYCFKNIQNPGEGYPFDYLQYTTLWTGTPLVVLAISKDQMWYFVESTYSKGWIKSEHIAKVSSQQIHEITQLPKVTVMGDHVLLKGNYTNYQVHTGTLLPYDNTTKQILYPVKSVTDNQLIFDKIKTTSTLIKPFPISFTKKNVKTILSQMLGGKYSWGGIDGGRDCSSTLKDYFTPFGIWMPRNSNKQQAIGKTISLEEKSANEKNELIKSQGLPFLSTLYLPGHIVLYVGANKKNSKMQIYHAKWGLKMFHSNSELYKVNQLRGQYGIYGLREKPNKNIETRFIIGKTVITDLDIDKPIREASNLQSKNFIKHLQTLSHPSM